MPKCSLSAGANEIYHGYIVYISRIRQVCNCNLINHSATQSDMLVPTKPLHFISFHIVWLYLIWFHFISLAASDRQKLPRKNRLAWVCFFRARAPLSVNILKGSSAANQKHKLAEIKSNPKAASLIISGFCTVWLFVIYCDVFLIRFWCLLPLYWLAISQWRFLWAWIVQHVLVISCLFCFKLFILNFLQCLTLTL